MSAYRRCLSEVEELEALCATLSEAMDPEAFRAFQGRLSGVEPAVAGLRANLRFVDPVTSEPRYGPQMKAKVEALLERFEAVCGRREGLEAAARLAEEAAAAAAREEAARREAAEEERRAAEVRERDAARARAEGQKQEDAARAEEAEAEARRMAELAAQSREQRRLAEVQAARARQEAREAWQRAAGCSSDAFRAHLARVEEEATAAAEYKACLLGLHVIISNVCKRPEQDTYKRIRMANEQFHADVGRFDAARRCLASVGFHLIAEMVGPEGCEVEEEIMQMREPVPEVDMDGWSAWYDVLSAALEGIEAAMQERRFRPLPAAA